MEIRKLVEQDVEPYQALRLRALLEHPEAFASSYEESVTRSLDAVREQLRATSASPDTFILGAFADGEIVGMVGFFRESHQKMRHKGTIWGMYVVPDARGKGAGKLLISQAIARALALPDLEQINLTVTTVNSTARNLYSALGFEPYGIEPHALKLDDTYLDEELMVLRFR